MPHTSLSSLVYLWVRKDSEQLIGAGLTYKLQTMLERPAMYEH